MSETTPDVSDSTSTSTPAGSPNASASGLPVTGMYFLHPDHLGSTTMITGANGKVITGSGGQSRITYMPYGSIDRPNSGGPDIAKYKFTGQEEDSETGLLYYKARYYDPMIASFTSPDSIVQPTSPSGMNRYAYVSRNPVRYRDPSGHLNVNGLLGAMIGYVVAPQFGMSREQGAMAGFGFGGGFNKSRGNFFQRSDIGRASSANFNSFMRSDIGRFHSRIGETARSYLKDPLTTIKNGDIGRSDIGQAGFHALGEIDKFVKYPIETMERNDITRSDYGKMVDEIYK